MNNYQQIVLASRPQGVVSPANFRIGAQSLFVA